jgi:hypothetical protein
MKRLAHVVAWLVVLLGARSLLVALRELGVGHAPAGLFLMSSGLLVLLCGALLVVVAVRSPAATRPLRAVAVLGNVAAGALVLAGGVSGGETGPAAVGALVLLAGAATVLLLPARRLGIAHDAHGWQSPSP